MRLRLLERLNYGNIMKIKTKVKYLIKEINKELELDLVETDRIRTLYTKLPLQTYASFLGLTVDSLVDMFRVIKLYKKTEILPYKKYVDRGYFEVFRREMSIRTGKPIQVVFITEKGSQKVIQALSCLTTNK